MNKRSTTRGRAVAQRSAVICLLPGRRVVALTTGIVMAIAAFGGAVPPAMAAQPALPREEVPVTATNLVDRVSNTSPVIAVDPTEKRFVALAHRRDGPDFGCGLAVSGDGGRGWLPAFPVPKLPEGADKCYAPEVAFDAKGNLYYLFIGLSGAGNAPMGVFLTKSTTRGASFSPPRRVLAAERYMVRMALDPTVGDRGRIHLVWLEAGTNPPLGGLPPPPNPIMTAYSDDGGSSFTEPLQVSDPHRPLAVAPTLALGPDHAVHVLYYDLGNDLRDYQGLEGPTWEGNWSLVLATSNDGGRSFSKGSVLDSEIVPPERVMLIFTMPPASLVADRDGRLYAAWTDARNGDWDVYLRRSADGGRTWGDARRVNDDKLKNGLHQFLPRLATAPDGRVDVVFYDRRGNVENRGNDVYFTSSTDRGVTFAANIKLTAVDSDSLVGYQYGVASAQSLHEWGSRLGLAALPGGALAAWTDARNSGRTRLAQDIYASHIDMGGDAGAGRSWVSIASVALALGGLSAAAVARLRRWRRTRPDRRAADHVEAGS